MVASLLAWPILVGCAQQKHPMVTMEKMEPAPRPAALEKLDPLVGKWEGSGEGRMEGMDEPMKSTGTMTVSWDCDKRVLMERHEGQFGETKFSMLGVWAWDPAANHYRVYWFDNFGSCAEGTCTYDEASKTWHVKAKGVDAMTGSKTRGEGKMHMIDSNTMEHTWTEWDSWGLKKKGEFRGTSKRK